MKKIVLFLLMMLPVAVIADDFKWFDEPFQTLHEKSFKVIQALDDHYALVKGKGDCSSSSIYCGEIYLIENEDGRSYYDGQIIKVPRKSVVAVIGTYRYITVKDRTKTVAIIKIMKRSKRDKITLKKRRND